MQTKEVVGRNGSAGQRAMLQRIRRVLPSTAGKTPRLGVAREQAATRQ
jgi:hypothetical protein